MVFVETRSESVLGVADTLGSVQLLGLFCFGVRHAMPGRDCADERLGGGNRVHDLVPWWLGDGVAREHLVVQLLGDGLEDPRGPYLSAAHDAVLRRWGVLEIAKHRYSVRKWHVQWSLGSIDDLV